MDSMFDAITDFINNHDHIIDTDKYNAAMHAAETKVLSIDAELPPAATKQAATVPPAQSNRRKTKPVRIIENLMDDAIRERTRSEIIFKETRLFTGLVNTTNTLEGHLSSVQFHEAELIKLCHYTDDVIDISCNYGRVTHPDHLDRVAKKKSKKKKKKRKRQGHGNEFSSQVTFSILRADSTMDPYKFKVFRPGQVQLPGARMVDIDDILVRATTLANYLAAIMHVPVDLTHMAAVMKNYKFVVKMPPGYMINLSLFKHILTNNDTEYGVFMVKYSRQDSKLAIVFSTPTATDCAKTARVNVFMGGKINILGAFDRNYTERICETLHKIIEKNESTLLVRADQVNLVWQRNIDEMCVDHELNDQPDHVYLKLMDEDNLHHTTMRNAWDVVLGDISDDIVRN